jgi:hypothetical protein
MKQISTLLQEIAQPEVQAAVAELRSATWWGCWQTAARSVPAGLLTTTTLKGLEYWGRNVICVWEIQFVGEELQTWRQSGTFNVLSFYVRGKFSPDIKWSECNPDHSFHLTPRLRMNGAAPPLPLYCPIAERSKCRPNFSLIVYMYVRTYICVWCFVACVPEGSNAIAGGVYYCCYLCLRIRPHYQRLLTNTVLC